MKKTTVLILSAMLFFLTANADEGITFFNGTFKEALVKAKNEKKLLFLDCYAVWCGPCKWMAAHVFTNDTVADFFNKNFISLASDMEKGEGLELAKTYSVKNYPTYIWLDENGKQIQRSVGSATASAFLTIAGNAMNPQKNLAYYREQYLADNRKPEFLLDYAHALSAAYDMSYQTIADEYFRSVPAEELSSEQNWKTILEFTPNINSYVYSAITKSPQKFYDRYGKDSVQHVLDDLALRSLDFAAQQKDSALFAKANTQLQKSSSKEVLTKAAEKELNYYKATKNMSKYTSASSQYVPKYFFNDAKTLNAICWTYFQRVDDKAKLAESEKWIAQSVKLDDAYYNTDTYANILHKEGKIKEAIEMTKHSIELAKKSGEDYSSTQDLLNELEKAR
jgi:thiol-disulfide isomerase/thioredoxin